MMQRIETRMKFAAISILVLALSLGGLVGCTATQKGAAIGAAAGAAVGAAVGNQSGNTKEGAAIGAAAGAVTGGLIGHYMDKQAEDLAAIPGAKTERVGDEIRVTWESAILFDFDSAMLKLDSQSNLKQMAEVLNKYPDTDLVIAGHTDDKGADEYNQKLSERRAMSVRQYLVDAGVAPTRLSTVGYGESRPVAANDSELGRSENRRVEIEIRANEDLRAKAESQGAQG